MIKPELIELITLLRDGTKAGKFEWEDLSDLDDGMFRTSLPGGLVRLGRSRVQFEGDTGRTEEEIDYYIWVMDARGVVVEELTFHPNSPQYSLVAELYNLARSASRSGGNVLDEMLQAAKRVVGAA